MLFLFSVSLAVFCSLCSLNSLIVSLRPFSSLSTSVLCFFVCVRSPLVFRVCLFGGGGWCNRRRGWCSCVSWPMLLSVSRFYSSFSCSLCSLFFSFFFFNLLCFLEKKQRNESLLLYSSFPSLLCPFFSFFS